MGFWTSVALVTMAVGSAVASIVQASKNKPQTPELPKIPTVGETLADSEAKAAARMKDKRRAMSRSKTIFTSPLGIAGEADTVRKTLLGQ